MGWGARSDGPCSAVHLLAGTAVESSPAVSRPDFHISHASIFIRLWRDYWLCNDEFAIMFYKDHSTERGGACDRGRLLRDPGGTRIPPGSLASRFTPRT